MRITTRLTLLSIGIAAALAFLLPALVWSFLAFNSARADFRLSNRMQVQFLQRTSFRDQYFLYREDRLRAMWEQEKAASDALLDLAGERFRVPEDRARVQRLRRLLEETGAIFRRIVGNTPMLAGPGDSRPVYAEQDKRLASQLLLKATAVNDVLTRLREAHEARVEHAYHRLAYLAGLLGISLALVTVLSLTQIGRLISRRLAPLHAGVKTIADGHLDFRFGLAGPDEFSELGRAIDAMAARLEASTAQLGEEISRRRILTAQREGEARFRAWFELSIIGICITSPAMAWLEVNDQLVAMLGYGREELLGKTWAELTHPDDLDADLAQFQRVLRGEQEGYAREKRYLRKDGGTIHTELAVRCVRRPDGSVDYFVTMVQDLTRRKQAEAERGMLADRMSQIQKLEALGVLVAGVSHNINNVLAAIMGMASCQETVTADPRDQEAYRIIGTACRRGRDVVRSLTQFARPTLAHSEPVDLRALIGEVCALLESTTRNRIRIDQALGEEPLWVDGHAGGLSHALMNLCLNALDAMPDGGTLAFRAAAAGDWIEVAVEDSGHGMPPEVLARVREPFFTTKEVGKGTGLGLSMTHGVIKVHGGTMDIESEPGQGTRVKLRLPRIAAPAAAPPGAPEPAVRPLDMLLVDDDEDVRILVARMLNHAGHRVTCAAGGEEALARLGAGALPDLVILDQNMPGMNGVQTLARIRALHPHLPILISSGQPGVEDWECFRGPGLAVIPKPFELAEIQARLAGLPALSGFLSLPELD